MATTYLEYIIYLPSAAQVEALQAAPSRIVVDGVVVNIPTFAGFPPGRLYAAPTIAAGLYGATILTPTMPNIPPSIASEWITNNVTNPNYPLDEDKFERKGAGWFGISWLFPDNTTYRWMGTFAYRPTDAVLGDDVVAGGPMPVRRWIDGFEFERGGNAATNHDQYWSRAASRHTSGHGMIINGGTTGTGSTHLITEGDDTGTLTATETWERFYLRVMALGDAGAHIWRGSSAAHGYELAVTPTGQLALYHVVTATLNLLGTSALAFDLYRYYKIDIVQTYGTGAALRLYIDGVLQMHITGITGGAGTAGQTHIGSRIGAIRTLPAAFVGHVDDWIAAAPPADFDNLDWLNGTKIVKLKPTAFHGDHDSAAWGGQWERAYAHESDQTQVTGYQSTTNGALFDLILDDLYRYDRGAIGPVSMKVVVTGWRGSVGTDFNPDLGWSVAGAARDMAEVTFGSGAGAVACRTRLYNGGTGVAAPIEFHPIRVCLQHATDVNTTDITNGVIGAEVELVGVWDQADISPLSVSAEVDVPGTTGVHASPYPNSPYARPGVPPAAPVSTITGTYTGDGLPRTFTFPYPVTFFIVRALTGAGQRGVAWWSSMNTGKRGGEYQKHQQGALDIQLVSAGAVAEDDPEWQITLKMAGNFEFNNANTPITYQYLAFCDPGMRFSMNVGLASGRFTGTELITPLPIPTWLADYGWFQGDTATSLTTDQLYIKGPGHATETVSPSTATSQASRLAIEEGQIRTLAAFHEANAQQYAAALFRQDDGSSDPQKHHVLQTWTFTGDGAASRTLQFPQVTGKRPAWAYVTPHNGATFVRDPSHTGTTSSLLQALSLTANASTGITAGGIDQITLGSAANLNGIVYSVLVFIGGDTAGNNGWSANGEFTAVLPAPPVEWPGMPELPEIPDPIPDDWITGDVGGDPIVPVEPAGEDLEGQCVTASTKVCQQALAVVGVTIPITDITTDQTPEAYICRLFYSDTVNEVLRDFNWPIFTKWADLPLVAGSQAIPYNQDFTYAYRVPSDLIRARRIVRYEARRGFDPDPPQFQMAGVDAFGRLLTSNHWDPETEEPAVTVHLEYTYRPNCAASSGDALFREALVYKLASKLAPAIARNKVTGQDCLNAFEHVKARASVAAASEKQEDDDDSDASWVRGR
jgi:hypothetical protein